MRALTLTQPRDGLVASGIKLVENRPRPTINHVDFGTQVPDDVAAQVEVQLETRS